VTIKIADINDAENLYELNALLGNETSIEGMRELIRQNNREIICIAYIDNAAAGYCTGFIVKSVCHGNCRLDIESLFVKEEYRNKGVGKALINFLEKQAHAKNIFHFHINTGEDNLAAQGLYRKLGYAHTGEILLDKTIERN